MKHAPSYILLLGLALAGCRGPESVSADDLRDTRVWQQGQWDAAGRWAQQQLDPDVRKEEMMCMDAALAVVAMDESPWEDGKTWPFTNGQVEGTASLSLQEGPLTLLLSREIHRQGDLGEIRERSISLPLEAVITVRNQQGRPMGTLTLQIEGEDGNADGWLGPEDRILTHFVGESAGLVLSGEAVLEQSEGRADAVFTAGGARIHHFSLQTRGLDLQRGTQEVSSSYWDETWRFTTFAVMADELHLQAEFPEGIHICGWMESRRIFEALSALPPFPSQEQAESAVEQSAPGMHLSVFYEDDLSTPRSWITLRSAHILNACDDFWTWEPAFLFSGGLTLSIDEFFNSIDFHSFVEDSRGFYYAWQLILPHLL